MQHEQTSRPHGLAQEHPQDTVPSSRETLVCWFCGLVYQQTTTEYVDNVMHDQCPRCRQVPRHLVDDL